MSSHRADAPAIRRPRTTRKAASLDRLPPRSGTGPELTRRERNHRRAARQRSQLSVPHVGIAGALGLATIAAPLSGMMAPPPAKATVNVMSAQALARPAFPLLRRPYTAVDDLRLITDDSATPVVPGTIAAEREILVTRASRSDERAVLPGCDGTYPDVAASNGRLPASMLCTLWDGDHQLRADAAVAFAKLNVAFKQRFGTDICVSDAYRTLSAQYAIKSVRGGFAAQPGTSNHGWGLAVDLCNGIQTGYGAPFTWLRTNAPQYGWDNPNWARIGGGGPHEPWHWEYLTGETNAASDA